MKLYNDFEMEEVKPVVLTKLSLKIYRNCNFLDYFVFWFYGNSHARRRDDGFINYTRSYRRVDLSDVDGGTEPTLEKTGSEYQDKSLTAPHFTLEPSQSSNAKKERRSVVCLQMFSPRLLPSLRKSKNLLKKLVFQHHEKVLLLTQFYISVSSRIPCILVSFKSVLLVDSWRLRSYWKKSNR